MRIACVHVPQFALQSATRVDAALRVRGPANQSGKKIDVAVAVVGAGSDPAGRVRGAIALHSPIVVACSRAAWALGVRLGMTAAAARFISTDLRIVTADPVNERETVRALADTLLGISPVVDVGGRVGSVPGSAGGTIGGAHHAMYCEVPARTRGASFGERVLELLESIGITARVGIADDRFTAWVAAAHGGDDRAVISVPRGGSAAFLAPRPLSLLAITPEVQHMLEQLGVRTLGEFAALPAPSTSSRGAGPLDADFQALARGDSGNVLRPYAPEAPIREELAVAADGNLFVGAEAAATIADRIARRLIGRARGAARLEVTILGETGERVVPVVPVAAGHLVSSRDDLTELIAPLLHEAPGAIGRLRVVVTGEAIAGDSAEVAPSAPQAAAPLGAVAQAPAIDNLAVVLSTTGSAGYRAPQRTEWQLTAPTLDVERRFRRTRRGKQRREPRTAYAGPLFGTGERGR